MTCMCGKWFKCLRKGYNMWEMAKLCGKWRKYLTIGLNMWEMT